MLEQHHSNLQVVILPLLLQVMVPMLILTHKITFPEVLQVNTFCSSFRSPSTQFLIFEFVLDSSASAKAFDTTTDYVDSSSHAQLGQSFIWSLAAFDNTNGGFPLSITFYAMNGVAQTPSVFISTVGGANSVNSESNLTLTISGTKY